jgi:TolB-like protein/DNA-binding winged helix-turn-helix (wHTH) protein
MNFTGHSVLRIGAWRVDPALDEICKDGAIVKLEPRAMGVLMCLAEHPGHVVTVDQILDTVWKDVVVTPDSVYQAVAALRKALGNDPKEPAYIANVVRRGYRLVAPVTPWFDVADNAPQGDAGSSLRDTGASVSEHRRSHLRIALVALVTMALGAGYFASNRWWLRHHGTPVESLQSASIASANDKSVAVLPFVDMSAKGDQGYFGDGLADELIHLLSRAPGTYVPARTSSFYFKGKQATIPEIATVLGVRHVLEGSVRTSGNRLRVTVQLIQVDRSQPVWSETFDGEVTDVFAVQDEIANAVAQVLKLSLLNDKVRPSLTAQETEAYSLLLQARFYDYQLFTQESEQRAVELYRQVVRLDPTSVAGWEGLSRAVAELPRFGGLSWQASRAEALSAAERAVALDPKQPAAHIALGKVKYIFDLDLPTAQREFDAARQLDSRDAYASLWAGMLAATLGHSTEALEIFHQGLLQDPLNYFLYTKVAAINYRLGRYTAAVDAARRAVELSPFGSKGHMLLAQSLLATGAGDAAVAEVERESYEGLREWGRARIYWFLRQNDLSERSVHRLETSFGENMAYGIAAMHALRGDAEQALQWLDRAYSQRAELLVLDGGLMTDPDFQGLHQDPRYREILREIGLPPTSEIQASSR